MGQSLKHNRARVERAIELHAGGARKGGLNWSDVARRLKVSPNTLRSLVYAYRRGEMPSEAACADNREAFEEALAARDAATAAYRAQYPLRKVQTSC